MAKAKSKVSFKTWATTIARARGDKAHYELHKLREIRPLKGKDADLMAQFRTLATNYQNYCRRGSQAA